MFVVKKKGKEWTDDCIMEKEMGRSDFRDAILRTFSQFPGSFIHISLKMIWVKKKDWLKTQIDMVSIVPVQPDVTYFLII